MLYLIVSLLSVALVFFVLGAPLIAALEVIVYAGAIMVLFVFVMMMLNLGGEAVEQERLLLGRSAWIGPLLLATVLAGELVYVIDGYPADAMSRAVVEPKQVGMALFGPYVLGVELASLLLLAGLVGAFHLGRRRSPNESEK